MALMIYSLALILLSGCFAPLLPPLNGFASEFMIYMSVFSDKNPDTIGTAILILAVVAGLAMIGGLAIACFTKAFGACFLGEPRTKCSQQSHEVPLGMRLSMVTLAISCVLLGLLAPYVLRLESSAIRNLAGCDPLEVGSAITLGCGLLSKFVMVSVLFLVIVIGLAVLRKKLISQRSVTTTVTWGCGYAKPDPRMQYTASSFAQPLVYLFKLLLRTHSRFHPPQGIFPEHADFNSHTEDLCQKNIYHTIFQGIVRTTSKLQWFQSGLLQLYVLYIALILLILLIWNNL